MNALDCPTCEQPLPADAPEGLCPTCLLNTGLEGSLATASAAPFEGVDLAELAEALPDYVLGELIGRGGMGAVYAARHRELDREVAIKVLPPELAEDPTFVERFLREARTTALLDHANVVKIHACGESDGLLYLILERVHGRNLRQLLREEGQVPPERALQIATQIAAGLAYAHRQGVVHRDVKPENVLVDEQGRVRLVDFGLAKLTRDDALAMSLTRTRQALGTPHYMAPEQLERPDAVDARADVFAVGVVLYEMLTGHLPLGRFPDPSATCDVNEEVDDVVLGCLERDPDDRFASAEPLHTALRSIGEPTRPLSTEHCAAPPSSGGKLLVIMLAIMVPIACLAFAAVPALFLSGAPMEMAEPEIRVTPMPAPERVVPERPRGQPPRSTQPTPRSVRSASPLNARPSERARVFELDPYRRNPVTERIVKDWTAFGAKLREIPSVALRDQRITPWIEEAGVVPENSFAPDYEWAYHARLHREMAQMDITALSRSFGERLFYGDVIMTGDYRGTNAVLVGRVDGQLRVLAPEVRPAEFTATPPPSMSYPHEVPTLGYWPLGVVGPLPLDAAAVRAQGLTAAGKLRLRAGQAGLGPEWKEFTLTDRAREVFGNPSSPLHLYADVEMLEIYVYSDADLGR